MPKVMKWLADHPRWTFQFTPTSASQKAPNPTNEATAVLAKINAEYRDSHGFILHE